MILLISLITHQILRLINARLNRMKQVQSFQEPELLMFNESFDAIQLNLRRKSINSLHGDDFLTSFEMLKNLNKLYDNVEYKNESMIMDSMETVNQTELMEVSEYIDDSIFNTILFDQLINDQDALKLSESFLEKSENKLNNWQDAYMCQSLGRFTQSNSSIGSLSSTPSSVNTRVKSYRVLRNSLLFKTAESRSKKLRSRTERLRQARNFYQRHQRTSSLDVPVNAKNFVSNKYRPSFKVEKLLNDSRGMKKYLIDYDGLMSHKNQPENKNTISLNNLDSLCNESNSFLSSSAESLTSNDFDLNNDYEFSCSNLRGALVFEDSLDDKEISLNLNPPSSNRCSSGYLSDC